MEDTTIYEQVGGMTTFERLTDNFYDRIEQDPLLRPMFPASLDEPKHRLALFLAQFFGGPETYSEQRGHPRLRARHLPFPIGRQQRDAWVGHMLAAIDAVEIPEPARTQMQRYFQDAATFLINQFPGRSEEEL
jgi:hemoglobin